MTRARPNTVAGSATTLVICCGAVAREIVTLVRDNGWDHMRVESLPAKLHNDPGTLLERLRAKVRSARGRYQHVIVLYSDCGTGGGIERMLEEEGVDGIGGAHCYEIFTGPARFRELIDSEPGCFFVTDFLARHFDRLVYQGLGLDRFPGLRNTYFGNYTKLVYLAQSENEELEALARDAARKLGLEFEIRHTGYGAYEEFLGKH
ncbi:MAG: DUF1638 domain-containing protein [bacterium]